MSYILANMGSLGSACFVSRVFCLSIRKKNILNLYLMKILNVVWKGYLVEILIHSVLLNGTLFSIPFSATVWLLFLSVFYGTFLRMFCAQNKCSGCLLTLWGEGKHLLKFQKHHSLQLPTLSVFCFFCYFLSKGYLFVITLLTVPQGNNILVLPM